MMDWCLIFLVSTIDITVKEKTYLTHITLEEAICD